MAGFHRETKKKNRFERALQTDRHTDRPSQRQKIVDSYAKRGVNIYNSVIQHSWVDLTSSGGGEDFPPLAQLGDSLSPSPLCGRPWNHAKCCAADPCCHGNKIWAKIGSNSACEEDFQYGSFDTELWHTSTSTWGKLTVKLGANAEHLWCYY